MTGYFCPLCYSWQENLNMCLCCGYFPPWATDEGYDDESDPDWMALDEVNG